MEMRQLKIFCAVADEGSFTAAAEKIHTVQSNITQRIKELEDELGRQLFLRQKTGTTLTSAGHTFLGYATRILQMTEESRMALRDDSQPLGPLRFGSMETTAAIRLPAVLAKYRQTFPKVQLSLITGTTAELLKAVESHKIDGAFVGGQHQNPVLHQEAVFTEELVLLSSSDYRSLKEISNAMSQVTVLVFRAGCFYRSTFENWFYKSGLTPAQILELGTLDGILSCVAAGMGVTLLPKSVAEQHLMSHALQAHRLPSEFSRIKTVFVRRNDVPTNPALEAFLEMIRAQERINSKKTSRR